MDEPSRYEKLHWNFFNTSARVGGYAFMLVSAVFIVLTILSSMGRRIDDAEYPLWSLILFVPVLALGFMMTRAKPYYPRKYREWYEQEQKPRNK